MIKEIRWSSSISEEITILMKCEDWIVYAWQKYMKIKWTAQLENLSLYSELLYKMKSF